MDYEYRHTKGSHLLSSPVYLKGECLVKNELLENTILQRNFITADTLPVLSTDNKLLSTLRFQTENHILTPCRKDTVNPTHDECSTKEPTDDYTTFKSQPVDWLQNAVVKISDVLPQNIFDCGCGETAEKQLVQDKFDLSINECKDTCRQPKIDLISCISSSIVDGIPSRERKKILGQLIQTCVSKDPEFILKAALYCRRELNIRTTTNLLIASACFHEKSQAFVSKYFSACISTPSDWLEVTEYYAVISGNSPLKGMPKVLRKNLTEKFSEFDQYQLAKHCRHKARANRSAKSKLQIKQPFGETMDTQVYTFIHRLTNSPPVYFTMKDIIRRLHISSPRFNVMCILGKKYPLDATDFIRMGLEGDWDESKAGKRMKLPVPLTWETELSVNGNNANSWTKLITSNKVPHMAMLRNLRNILKSGIPNSIHEIVLKRLTDARIIIDGKQFPFRYFTAFNTIHKLKTEFVLTRYLRAMQEKSNRRFRTVPRRLTKKYLWVEDYLRKVNLIRWTYDAKLLDRYQKALNTALELSIQHNLPPVCGSTLIICSTSKYTNRSAQKKSSRSKSYMPMMGFLLGVMCTSICEAPTTYVTVDNEYNVTPLETILEQSELKHNYAKSNNNETRKISCKKRQKMKYSGYMDIGILQKVNLIYEKRGSATSTSITSVLEIFYAHRKQFDKVVVFGDCHQHIIDYVANYRAYIGPIKAIWGNLSGEDKWSTQCSKDGWIEFRGCTDQILRYIAEPNEDKLLERVEKIDEIYRLNVDTMYQFNCEDKHATKTNNDTMLSQRNYFKSAWSCCQLFISSTFLDMYGERDLICGVLVPALREKVAVPLRVHLNEIDLRWGVPEMTTYSSHALQICLEQAAASDIFVLLLGDRYGWVPNEVQINGLPKPLLAEVLKFYKPGMSVTEMEYHIAKQTALSKFSLHERQNGKINAQEAVRLRICVFIRDSKCIKDVPSELRNDFEEVDKERSKRLHAFKELIQSDGVVVFNNYPAKFNRLFTDHPVMENLYEFGNTFLSVIRSLLLKFYKTSKTDNHPSVCKSFNTTDFLREYVYSAACVIGERHLLEVERAFIALNDKGRQAHLSRKMGFNCTTSDIHRAPNYSSKFRGCDGGVLLITGSPGSGKTTYLSALALSLTETDWYPPLSVGSTQLFRSSRKEHSVKLRKDVASGIRFASQRPVLAKHHIFIHFCGGLAVTCLPPKRSLIVMLKKWTSRLLTELKDLCASSEAATKLLNEIELSIKMSTSSTNMNTSSSDSPSISTIQCFTRIINFIGYLQKLRFVFLIDDCHLLQPMTFEWLPMVLPKNVRFVLTCDSKSPVARSLSSRVDCLLLPVYGLTTNERCVAVRSLLARYGKVLNESGFQNQLSMLVRKRDADIPLYLKLACEELRLFGNFEQLDEKLKQLPETISSFVEHAITRVELDCGLHLTRIVLGFLTCSKYPLSTDELHNLIDNWLYESIVEQTFEDSDIVDNEGKCTAYLDPWKELKVPNDDASVHLNDMISNESIIQEVISDPYLIEKLKYKCFSAQPHLPSLALHILLTGLHPLLSGFSSEENLTNMDDDDNEGGENSRETIPKQNLNIWNLGSRAISFRSREICDLVYDVCFKRSNDTSKHKQLGYHKNLTKSKMSESDSNNNTSVKKVTLNTIHRILANRLSNTKDMVYHLYHAQRLDVVACLLISPTFLMHQLQSGNGLTLLEDFRRFLKTDRSLSLPSVSNCNDPSFTYMKDRIVDMQNFIASNYQFLIEHPSSFAELAINQNVSDWIQKVGLTCLFYLDSQSQTASCILHQMFLRIKPDENILYSLPKVTQPAFIYKPITPLNGSQDVPISVELNQTGTLLAYGTESGTVSVIEVESMKVLCSFHGHNLPVLTLCFIDNGYGSNKPHGISTSQLWLASTCQDGSMIIWDISSVTTEAPSSTTQCLSRQLCSSTGCHRRPVTVSAWHPQRQVLATGSLDCLVCLWEMSELGFGSLSYAKPSNLNKLTPSQKIKTNSPINALVFRLSDYTSDSENSVSNDVMAIGCWDGFVYFYNLVSRTNIMSLSVSPFSISSLAYSPNDTNILAILDKQGQTHLLDADMLVSFGTLTEEVNLSTADTSTCFEESLHLSPVECGKLCFSKPNGRYLIQTGNGMSGSRINVWNARLGVPKGPWIDLNRLEREGERSIVVTTYALDVNGHHIINGWNDGIFTVVSIESGDTLFISDNLVPLINDKSSIEAIACSHSPFRHNASLLIVGWSSGAVRLFHCEFNSRIDTRNDGNLVVDAEVFVNPTMCFTHLITFWSHSIEHAENGIGEAGGTLCVATSNSIAVSGGGNCETWVYFIDSKLEIVSAESVCLRNHNGQVTAVDISSRYIATGSKDKNVAVYEYDRSSKTVRLKHMIYYAADDWITSLSWSYTLNKSDSTNLSLFIGSNDQLIRRYSIHQNSCKIRQTLASHKSEIKSLDFNYPYLFSASTDGHIIVWKCDKTDVFQFVSQMNVSVSLNPNEVIKTSTSLVKIESFTPKHFNSKSKKRKALNSQSEPEISCENEDCESKEVEVYNSRLDNEEDETIHLEDNNSSSSECTLEGKDVSDNNGEQVQEFEIFGKCRKRLGMNRELFRDTDIKLLVGQITTSSSSDRHRGFRFRTCAPCILGYHATLSGHAGLKPCGITCAKSPDSYEDILLVSVAGQNSEANTLGCDIRLWNLPLPDTSILHEPIQHTGPVISADHLKVTDNLRICISGSTDGICTFWAIIGSTIPLNMEQTTSRFEFLRMNSITWKPLICLTNSYRQCKYPINSIVTQIWLTDDDENGKSTHYFIYIACGYEVWVLHIHLDYSILTSEINVENTIMQLFSTKGKLNISLSELSALWTSEKVAEIKKYNLDHVVVQMSAISQQPGVISQCGVVALLSNGEVVIMPYACEDDEFRHIRVQNDSLSNLWCTSLSTYAGGVLVAHAGSALFYPYADEGLLFKPLCGSINDLENVKIDTVEPLYLPVGNDMILSKIVTSSMKSEPRIVIFNDKNEMIINIMLSESNLSVTAYCVTSAYFDNQASLSVNLLLATSDGVLRLIKCSTSDYNQSGEGEWEQIRIYPTGEQVTKLLAINSNPLTIMCGHHCGEINFYTIL